MPARPFGLLDQLVARDPHRIVDLGFLDRRVLGVLGMRLDRVGPVAGGARTVAAGDGLEEREQLAVARVATAEPDVADHPLGARRHELREALRERDVERLDHPDRGLPAADHRVRVGRVVDRARRRHDPDEVVEAGVDGDVGVDQRPQDVRAVGVGLGVGRVDRRAPLHVRAAEVEQDAVVVDHDLDVQLHGVVAVAVGVDEAVGFEDAPGERPERGLGPARGVREQLVEERHERLAPQLVDERRQAPDTGVVARDLSAQVARRLALGADLLEHER